MPQAILQIIFFPFNNKAWQKKGAGTGDMRVMRTNRESMMAMLEAFVYDPLISWRLLNTAECPKSAFVSEIKVISASQTNSEGRAMYLQFGAGGECHSSTMVEAVNSTPGITGGSRRLRGEVGGFAAGRCGERRCWGARARPGFVGVA